MRPDSFMGQVSQEPEMQIHYQGSNADSSQVQSRGESLSKPGNHEAIQH